MNVVKLPEDLSTLSDVGQLNRALREGRIVLDWSAVRVAPRDRIAALLTGLALDRDGHVIGPDTIPDEFQDVVIAACQSLPMNSGEERANPPAVPGPIPAAPPATPAQLAALRSQLVEMVRADLLGPAGGDTEEVNESHVSDRYLVGLLAPRRRRVAEPEQEDVALESQDDEDGPSDRGPAAPSIFPSSAGLSFCVSEDIDEVVVTAGWGHYQRAPSANATTATGQPKRVWRRRQAGGSVRVKLTEGQVPAIPPDPVQPLVTIQGVARTHPGGRVVTLFLVNGQDEPEQERDQAWLFQVTLEVAADGKPVFSRRSARELDGGRGDEAAAMTMLYRNRIEFAVGHGVAAAWDLAPGDTQRAVRVRTVPLPDHDVPRMTPRTVEDDPNLGGLVLDMGELAGANPDRLAAQLEPLPAAYTAWIKAQRARALEGKDGLTGHRKAAEAALARCERAAKRIREGVALLQTDAAACEAFRFANRAMALQRVHSLLAEAKARGEPADLADVNVPKNRTWYPFQLGFILQALPGITRLDHPERSDAPEAVADLLWFPTGGGKTEAYLGLAAFTMALRRLQGEIEGRRGDVGVAVLMRYTLRVLTIQQFQRASALLCACEVLRREELARGERRLGDEPFRIGLWVGQRTTPNWTDQAHQALIQAHGHRGAPGPAGSGSPQQLEHCPWCGTRIDPGNDMEVEQFGQGAGRTLAYCGDRAGECPFSRRQAPREGLPVVVVDEEIYRLLPSMVVATVDKFAQMPWNGTIQMLFGHVDGRCSRHGFRSPGIEDSDSHPAAGRLGPARTEPIERPLRPPDLIIQDELHLISGPLGTLTGLYETAVDALCTWDVDGRRVRPKVIASTATIRRAREQVNGLFLRDVQVFPPHGVDVEDSFFALERRPEDAAGRCYLGICAPGRRLKAVLIRSYVAWLAAAQRLYELQGRRADPWMTLVGYFNSIRELAGMRRLVEDDVRTRCRDMDRRGLARRKLGQPQELTSRIGSTDIPKLLARVEIPFDPAAERGGVRPLDVLLATNMISVGVDVKRLGLMVVAGQPKTTAEYIQATSRVGRSHPGIVCTVYNWARPRDLSHYERFEQYHATFYQQVEATSVTPFSSRALDRGLSALMVALVRLAARKYNPNAAASGVEREDPLVIAAIERIVRRAEHVTGSKAVGEEVRALLKRRLDTWLHEAQRTVGLARLGYRMEKDGSTRGLLDPPGLGRWKDFTCLTSLRDVEPGVNLVLDERPMEDRPHWRAS
ncbi:DISARM system helicase DrmA [Anaeromyxobacter oryzisoli]|uniref:DISARM system helicase DrmA n=1 Tax=Anaeromyxobacter oryzisoli TaxID=2925408 RepID=UPI001F576E44|nr:DISARM system helicase DrmA [Anaeromyxobacter sp. SG63]